ncbi:MAG: preprotein translocase subunit SecE [Gammaproteobacteria bacterium]
MKPKTETSTSSLDAVMLGLCGLLVAGALGAFYYFGDQSLLLRVVGLLAVIGLALALGFRTQKGRDIWAFMKEAQVEVRKVVWPTRQETVRTTLLVVLMVVTVAGFLWVLDAGLSWLVQWLTGQEA